MVREAVAEAYATAARALGPVRFEWVFDGTRLWIVQLTSERRSLCRMRSYPATRGTGSS